MRLVLHIGNHKTGSTSIQKSLFERRRELIEKGVLYPSAGLVSGCHHNYTFSLRGYNKISGSEEKMNLHDIISDLRVETGIHKPSTVILSSEEFISLNENEIMKLSPLFDMFDQVIVIVYLRNQWDLIESSYRFNVFWDYVKESRPFSEYVEFNIKSEYHVTILAKDYYKESLTGLVDGFYKELGVEGGDITRMVHKSKFRVSTIVMNLANKNIYTNHDRVQLTALITNMQKKNPELKNDLLYTEKLMLKVVRRFYESNSLLESAYGIDLNSRIELINETNLKGDVLSGNDIMTLNDSGFSFKGMDF